MPESTREALQRATVNDLLRVLGFTRTPVLRTVFRPAATLLTRGFVRLAAEFDQQVGKDGLSSASFRFSEQLGATLSLSGLDRLPATGPLLIVANHPGLADTLALFSTVQRQDLKVIAEANPFLLALENVREHLIFLPESRHHKGLPLRPVLRHLKDGGALLTFPRGAIEADPALKPDEARESLLRWSKSISLLTRALPELTVLPIAVSGVLHPGAQAHPLTRIRRSSEGREQVGAFLQLLLPKFRAVTISVHTGEPLQAADTLPEMILAEMERLYRFSAGEARQQVKVVDVNKQVTVPELFPPDLQPPG